MKPLSTLALILAIILSTNTAAPADRFHDIFGPRFRPDSSHCFRPGSRKGLDTLHRWNQIAIDASGLDHAPVAPGENRVFGEQFGPGRSSRAMAIVHIAIFDAVNALKQGYRSYSGVRLRRNDDDVSLNAAIAQAGHDALVALYPSQSASFDALLAEDLSKIDNNRARNNGVDLGRRTAAVVLSMRAGDGVEIAEATMGIDYFTSNLPGHWRQDPISLFPLAIGWHWGQCVPFVLRSGSQFRAPPPPSMTSFNYASAYNETKRLGGDGIVTTTERTATQTFIGTFWAYDGTPSLCAPPRLYNQIARHIADQTRLNTIELARLLALVNTAMADAAISVWDSKYFYDVWRPITGIRESDPGTGPSGTGDGNPQTIGDPNFTPLGAPASNLVGPNFTPPFPSYPSGHAGIGGALFQTLRRFYSTDRIAFTFVSDEFNGITKDHNGNVRPYMPRSFSSLSQAEQENGQSRIYLGIHWSFDKTQGIALGHRVANYVFDHTFTPLRDR